MTSRALAASASKEFRVLFPVWAACMALLVGCELLDIALPRTYLILLYGFGSIALGAQALGQEFANGTIPVTLTLPISRRHILLTKLLVMALLLASIALTMSAVVPASASGNGIGDLLLVAGLSALFIAPAWTMVAGNALGGTVFTVATPAIVWLAVDLIGLARFGRNPHLLDAFHAEAFPVAMGLVLAVGAVATWQLFIRLEAVEGRGRDLHFPSWLSAPGGAVRAATPRHPLWCLFLKELRIQQLTFTLTAIFAVGLIIQVGILYVFPGSVTGHIMPIAVMQSLAGALIAGSLASAEERQLGTWQSQTMLPMAAWQQWSVKTGVAFGMVFLLGLGLTAAVAWLIPLAYGRGLIRVMPLVTLVLLTSLSLYVSSISKSGVRALVTVVLALFAVGAVLPTLAELIASLLQQFGWQRRRWSPNVSVELLAALGVGVSALFVGLGGENHRSNDHSGRAVALQLTVILAAIAVCIATIYIAGL